MKITSWNVNGVRSNIAKLGKCTPKTKICEIEKDAAITPILSSDIVCLQETKCTKEEGESIFGPFLDTIFPYRYWNSAVKGVGGVAVWSKIKPTKVSNELPKLYDLNKGRVLILKFDSFTLLNTYVPNTGRPEAWKNRINFNASVSQFLISQLEKEEPTIWTGDLNVVNAPEKDTTYIGNKLKAILRDESIDKRASSIGAGLTYMERSHLHSLIDIGYVDAFRELHPKSKKFTWYSYRSPETGWRLDYFMVPEIMMPLVNEVVIGPKNTKASDHIPVTLSLSS